MKNGEVWLVNFSPSVGAEIGKARPAIVIGNDRIGRLAVRVVVPVTNSDSVKHTWHVSLTPSAANGLRKPGVADCFQLKSMSVTRFSRKLGRLSDIELAQVKVCIIRTLDLA